MSIPSNPPTPAASRLHMVEQFLRQDPGNASLLLEAFDAALAAGQPEAANFHLVNAVALGQGSQRWRLNGIHLDLARHRWEDAAAGITALQAEPHLPPELAATLAHDLAYTRLRQERLPEALAALEPLLQRSPEPDPALAPATQALALRIWHRAEQVEQGVAWALARERLGLLAPDALGPAALLALDATDLASCARWAQLALAQPSPSAEALVAASSLSVIAGEGAAAEIFAQRALDLDGSDARSRAALGLAQFFQRRLSVACTNLELAVTSIPGHVGTRLALGWAQLLSGQVGPAAGTFAQALELDRNFAECHGSLAAAQVRLGLHDEAHSNIERALRLDRRCASAAYAQLLLEGRDGPDDAEVARLARRLLGA